MTSGVPPAGVLFDVDGTLVDTTYLHTVAWWEALRGCGHDVPMASIHRSSGWAPTSCSSTCSAPSATAPRTAR